MNIFFYCRLFVYFHFKGTDLLEMAVDIVCSTTLEPKVYMY